MRRLTLFPLFFVLLLSACSEVAEPPIEAAYVGQPIFGGAPPTDARYDAVVGLITGGYYCSGTLIASHWVLTAGHCVVSGNGKRYQILSPNDIDVYFGPSISGSSRSVAEVILHSGYNNRRNGVNDIALLRLAGDASGEATPMRWLPSSMAYLETVGTDVTFAGYGYTEYDTIGVKLVVDGSISGVTSDELRNEQDDATGTCGGDSGGPLIYEFDGTFYVGGTTSWGDSACLDYGWSMRVSAYDGWITSYVGTQVPDCTDDSDCDDGNACTTNACSGGSCVFDAIDCDDSDACTTDSCSGGECANDPIYCDDGNDCTDDYCDSGTGCEATDDDTNTCDDGDDCTVNDSCSSGSCGGDDSSEPACMCLPKRASCSSNSDCCSNSCRRNGRCR